MDEGYTVNAVQAIERTGTDLLPSGVRYSCPLYCRPSAWIARELGDTPSSYRLLAAISGILVISVIFFAVSDLFSPDVGLLSAFFTAFGYFEIAWSRQARWYTLFELFFWLSLYFFYKSWYGDRRRALYGVLAALATVLAALTHGLGLILPFIYIAWILIDGLCIRKNLSWKQLLVPALAAIAALLVLIAIEYHSFASLLGTISLQYEFPYYATFYFRSYWLLILLALVPLWPWPLAYRRQMGFLLFVLACYVVPLSLLTDIVQYRYLFMLTPILFALAAVGVFEITALMPRFYQRVLFVGVILVLFFATGEGVLLPRSMYFLESDDPAALSGRSSYLYVPQPDWDSAYAYIKAHQSPSDIVISSMPQFNEVYLGESGYWLEYSYLGIATANPKVINGREQYADALVIPDAASLASTTASMHGYLVIDSMAEGRISSDELAYIQEHFTQVFYKETNDYSQVWVYQF
jgi:hypothetical protein